MNNTHSTHCWRSMVGAAMVMACAAAAVDVALAAEGGSESIGSQLLDDLDPNLFGPPAQESAPARPDFQKRILPGVTDDGEGEDIGQPSASEPLARVERKMETAAALLRQFDARDRASNVQQEVVTDLDALIEQLAKQCCSCACQPSDKPKPSSQRSQAKSAKPGSKPGRGTAAARDSTSQLRPGDPQAVNMAEREQLLKDLWGHLPPHVREQMLQSYSDEFLPQYELEIEKYFRRLAEEQGEPAND